MYAWSKLTPNTNTKKKITEKAFSQQKLTPSQIFLKDFVHFKNICFNNTSASDQFKTKVGNYNTVSFLSPFPWFKHYYIQPDFLLWVSVKNRRTNIVHPIYLIHIKFDTDFSTTLFSFIYYTNRIIFIILNTMNTFTKTITIFLIVVTFYFKQF